MEKNRNLRAFSIMIFVVAIIFAALLGWFDGLICALFVNITSTLTLDWAFFLNGITFIDWCQIWGVIAGIISMLYILLPFKKSRNVVESGFWKNLLKGMCRGLTAGLISFVVICLAILIFVRHGWIFNLSILGVIYIVPKWVLIGAIAYPLAGRIFSPVKP